MLTYNWIINVFCILILVIIKISYTKYSKSSNSHYTLFSWILIIAILFLFVDVLSRYDGLDQPIWRFYNEFGNLMLFLLSPILPSIWLAIVYSQVYNRDNLSKSFSIAILSINFIHLVLVIITQFNGWFYDISSSNIYHRGPLYIISPLLTVVILAIAFFLPVAQRKRIGKNLYYPFLFFPIPALTGIVIQSLVYGFDFSLKGLVISIFFYFTFVLSHQTTVDYLTGVYNRKGLDDYLKKLAHNATKHNTFTAIMLDLDNFKQINDIYGHQQGDEALIITTKIIKDSLNPHDFVARYGGDEFFIVLETGDGVTVNKVTKHLNEQFALFNQSQEKPYKLTFAYGVSVYDSEKDKNVENFRRRVDRLMYDDKEKRVKLTHTKFEE